MILDENSEIFVVYGISLNLALISIYLDRKAQIASLFTKKIMIPDKYSAFVNIFLEKKVLLLSEQIKFNEYAIKLENSKQLLYRPIYSLGLVELETLKTYIKTKSENRVYLAFSIFYRCFYII